MDMDSEHKLVGHVDGNDEADNLCEIKTSSELTQTENMTITATTFCRNGKKIKDWFRKIWEGKGRDRGEWCRCDVNMFEGGGGSCCI